MISSMRIQLSEEERGRAKAIASRRHHEAKRMSCRDVHGCSDDPGWHEIGALGECAVAKGLGIPWDPPINSFRSLPDIQWGPLGIEVKTRTKSWYELIVRGDDRIDWAYILVLPGGDALVDNASWIIRGWIMGHDAQRPEWVQTHGQRDPAWFVPHSALHDFSTLVYRASLDISYPSSHFP
jgi:hypothetical protein